MPLLIDGNKPKPAWLKDLPIGIPLYELQAYFIIETLKHFDGNRTHAVKALKISGKSMRVRLSIFRHFGFEIPEPKLGLKQPRKD